MQKFAVVLVSVTVGVAAAWAQSPGFWRISVVESEGASGDGSLAFWPDGRPALSYALGFNPGQLMYAEWDGSAWQRTSLGSEYFYGSNSLAILPDGPALAYQSSCNFSPHIVLRYAHRTGASWSTVNVAGCNDSGRTTCRLLAQPGSALPAIGDGYWDAFEAETVYSWFDGARWRSDSAMVGLSYIFPEMHECALSLLPSGQPAFAYCVNGRDPNSQSRYNELGWSERTAPGTWSNHVLQTNPILDFLGLNTAVVDGQLVISHTMRVGLGQDYHLWYWFPQTDLGAADPWTSLAVLRNGQPAIAYSLNGLRFTWRTNAGWRNMPVDSIGVGTRLMSLVIRPGTGQPALAYSDGAVSQVKFALAFFRGDLNCDGFVNFDDINPFVLALTDPAGYGQAFPECNIVDGDVNEDGAVNFDDINPFVALLAGN